MYSINWTALKAGPKLSGQSRAYLGGVAVAKMVGGFSNKAAHKMGVAAAGGYHLAKLGGTYHPFNLIPDKRGGMKAERPLIDRALGKAGLPTYWNPKTKVGGTPQFTTRTERIQSRGGQHTASSGRPGTRKSMRGPSAQKSKGRSKIGSRRQYFRRDEDRYT
jgi:hypothetical protein